MQSVDFCERRLQPVNENSTEFAHHMMHVLGWEEGQCSQASCKQEMLNPGTMHEQPAASEHHQYTTDLTSLAQSFQCLPLLISLILMVIKQTS